MAEYRTLTALTGAASPDRIVLAWLDGPPAPSSEKERAVPLVPPSEARRLARDLLGEGYGLPSAVLIGERGKACAVWRAPLRSEDIRKLQDRCRD